MQPRKGRSATYCGEERSHGPNFRKSPSDAGASAQSERQNGVAILKMRWSPAVFGDKKHFQCHRETCLVVSVCSPQSFADRDLGCNDESAPARVWRH